jgi:hypothetical protein
MKRIVLIVMLFAACAMAQTQSAGRWDNYQTLHDYWLVKQAGYTVNTWDSVTTSAVWSEPFLTWDFMSAIVRVYKDSVRGKFEYWAGKDTTRATMVFGRTLEWDKAADLDSMYVASTGYWSSNITAAAIPIHRYGRLKYIPGTSGGRVVNDDSLFAVWMTGRK